MGSLDAFLVAAGFIILGEAVWVIRLVQILLYVGVLLTTIWLGGEAFGSARHGILAAALLAIPTVNVSLYTMKRSSPANRFQWNIGSSVMMGNTVGFRTLAHLHIPIMCSQDT